MGWDGMGWDGMGGDSIALRGGGRRRGEGRRKGRRKGGKFAIPRPRPPLSPSPSLSPPHPPKPSPSPSTLILRNHGRSEISYSVIRAPNTLSSHPIPSHPIPSHPIPSHPSSLPQPAKSEDRPSIHPSDFLAPGTEPSVLRAVDVVFVVDMDVLGKEEESACEGGLKEGLPMSVLLVVGVDR